MSCNLYSFAKELLCLLIQTPSISGNEEHTANRIMHVFTERNIPVERIKNNVIVRSSHWDAAKPTILLNSHHDTVKPVEGWNTNPYEAVCVEEKIFGLGSNDAGASLVALLCTFLHYYNDSDLPYNLLFVASAEEEISGKNGIECVLPTLGDISVGIVGEPTGMNMAVAEKGLLVLDCVAKGIAGHAAHSQGENAIYNAIKDIQWLQTYEFPKKSDLLGAVKMTVTGISAGKQHNVIPDECTFMIDVRTNEEYTNKEVFDIISASLKSHTKARSFRLNSSSISRSHALVQRGVELGCELFGSATLSDQAVMSNFPTVKIGPGDTYRSHTAQEYIFESELFHGIDTYIALLKNLTITKI